MGVTPREGVRAVRMTPRPDVPNVLTPSPPPHLSDWQLPPDWRWGSEGRQMEYRHYQEIIDALGRSLSLVSAPDPAHTGWLEAEARELAHRNHPAIPTTYHYWAPYRGTARGPGYLRRWLSAESLGNFVRRVGPADIPLVFRVLRAVGSTLSYLHDSGTTHGAVSPENIWIAPAGRTWMLGWQWAIRREDVPAGREPDPRWTPHAPEWSSEWKPSPAADQWQMAACCFAALTGELPPPNDIPPVRVVRPDCPDALAVVIDGALRPDPEDRFRSVSLLLRALERTVAVRRGRQGTASAPDELTEEARLRWATGDDYDVLGFLGRGTFGSVWRVRDLSLEREVALKMLHPDVSQHPTTVARFLREARLAAQLAHPAIIPIYDLDSHGDVTWYTMELAEAGSVADLIARSGPRSFDEVAGPVEAVLDALAAAHTSGIVHRDLKPENILIDRYRRWRITDFGIAKGEDEPATATGTPAFAAPEQLLGEAQGPGVDCFAIGAIVTFVLTGDPPFAGPDAATILAKQFSGEFGAERFDAPVARFLETALAADPKARYADATAMRDAWRELRRTMRRLARSRRGWLNRFLDSGQS
ncbi:MAG TPA: serine/threonine-protein kinase [Gemmatimonadaceae bacterium]|jgi:serine/threonine-protein kinase|nr:serine/threonine-protein kinase [Gemmatimonadaceae bacterium]